MQWEYKTLAISATGFWTGGRIDGQALTDRLNEYGQEGWELVTVFDTNMHQGGRGMCSPFSSDPGQYDPLIVIRVGPACASPRKFSPEDISLRGC